jgi:hypothetical protein
MRFPKFLIHDMVTSQHKLLTEHLGINNVMAVVGASWRLKYRSGASTIPTMDSLISLVPLAKRRHGRRCWKAREKPSLSTRPEPELHESTEAGHPPVARYSSPRLCV